MASMQAYQSVDLDRREREVLTHIQSHFPSAEFTRAELADSMGWAINRICGRIVSLRNKGLLSEDKTRTVTCKATGGDAHPLRLNQSTPAATVFGKPPVVDRVGSHDEQSSPRDSIRKPFSGPVGTLNAPRSTHCDGNMGGEFRSTAVAPCSGSKVIASHAARPDTTSEEFRHACEVRYCANLQPDSARNKYLTGVHEQRGAAAWKRLREDTWRALRAAA